MSFFRYPGGKAKLKEPILKKIKELTDDRYVEIYVEPFFGGGSVCLSVLAADVLPEVKQIIINDFDYGIYALWHSVRFHPDKLKKMVKNFTPNIPAFYLYKTELKNDIYEEDALISTGFKKLALHQMSYSGLGVKAGGPIGGLNQSSKYDIGCRWSIDSICKKIDRCHHLLLPYQTYIYSLDFSKFIFFDMIGPFFFYLDPPYFEKGNNLYHTGFTLDDHKQLSQLLQHLKMPWLLSYDDCPEIRALYSWAEIEEINVNYTITTARNKKELLIYRK